MPWGKYSLEYIIVIEDEHCFVHKHVQGVLYICHCKALLVIWGLFSLILVSKDLPSLFLIMCVYVLGVCTHLCFVCPWSWGYS